MPSSRLAQQDRNPHKSVPPPGRKLVDVIRAGERAGRAVWHVPGVVGPAGAEDQAAHAASAVERGNPVIEVAAMAYSGFAVPKFTSTAEHHCNQQRMPLITVPLKNEPRRPLCPEVYVVLNNPDAAAWALVRRSGTAEKQLSYIMAAAYKDVRGWPLSDRGNSRNIADVFGYSSPDAAERAVQRGRAFLAMLSAWPWWSLGDIGELHHAPPVGWSQLPRVADHFAFWRDPRAYRAWERAERDAA